MYDEEVSYLIITSMLVFGILVGLIIQSFMSMNDQRQSFLSGTSTAAIYYKLSSVDNTLTEYCILTLEYDPTALGHCVQYKKENDE